MEASTKTERRTCYRHPNRETGVSCSNCGRPICPECMTSTPVGMRCPECARERTRVRTGAGAFSPTAGGMPATYALIAVNVIVFVAGLLTGGPTGAGDEGSLIRDGGTNGPSIADGDWWRIVTGGFLHAGFIHLLLNMYVLCIAGSILEPSIGTPRFLGIYFVGLLGGAVGALLIDPNATTVGASGAIFGLMAAVIVVARGRGIEEVASQFGLFVVLNLVLTFSIPGISVGGHIGGLIGGGLAAALVILVERQIRGRPGYALEIGGVVLMLAGTFAGALAAAG
ncbi:MAG TPA: rhomboid family intramembrane serine protease [Solirubrobacterales bacterium]|nr:rhomboid family intramembrane serine protease [Solirubrobacterales bacterium]